MTMDVEMPGNMTLDFAHCIADKIEREVSSKYGINLVIHMEPTNHLNDDDYYALFKKVRKHISNLIGL